MLFSITLKSITSLPLFYLDLVGLGRPPRTCDLDGWMDGLFSHSCAFVTVVSCVVPAGADGRKEKKLVQRRKERNGKGFVFFSQRLKRLTQRTHVLGRWRRDEKKKTFWASVVAFRSFHQPDGIMKQRRTRWWLVAWRQPKGLDSTPSIRNLPTSTKIDKSTAIIFPYCCNRTSSFLPAPELEPTLSLLQPIIQCYNIASNTLQKQKILLKDVEYQFSIQSQLSSVPPSIKLFIDGRHLFSEITYWMEALCMQYLFTCIPDKIVHPEWNPW